MPRSRQRRLPKRPSRGPQPPLGAKKPLPVFDTIAEAKRFLASANLDHYDLSPVENAAPPPPAGPEAPLAPIQPAPTQPAPPQPAAEPVPSPSARPAPRLSQAYEYAPKSARLTMRLPEALLHALKAEAQALGLPYQRLIREALERAVGGG